jgi:hypothetical protein
MNLMNVLNMAILLVLVDGSLLPDPKPESVPGGVQLKYLNMDTLTEIQFSQFTYIRVF